MNKEKIIKTLKVNKIRLKKTIVNVRNAQNSDLKMVPFIKVNGRII